jgi:hypothetical protein
MGVDCGFDIYPPLERTKAKQEQFELFLGGPRDGDGQGGSVVRVNAESEACYIDFEVGEHPHLPRRCEHFLRFSSKISGRSLAEPYIEGVYKIAKQWLGGRVYFWHEMNEFGPRIRHHGCYNWNEIHAARKKIGEHKQQAEEQEQEQEEIKTEDEVQQGDDGTDRMTDVPASRDGKGYGLITPPPPPHIDPPSNHTTLHNASPERDSTLYATRLQEAVYAKELHKDSRINRSTTLARATADLQSHQHASHCPNGERDAFLSSR